MISSDLHFRDALAFMCSNVFNFDTSNTSHEEMKQTALKRDEEQVQAIVNHLSETMTDPFDIEAHPPCLMNISTGRHYDFIRFAFQGCVGIHVFKCFQF
jgi:hypothetical protein